MPLFKLNIEAAERYLTSIPLLSLEEDIVRLLSTQNPKSAGLGSQLVEKQPHLLTSGSDELVAGDEGLHHESFLANETPDKSSVSVSRLPLDVEGAERFLNSLAVRAEDCASPFCHRPERTIGSLLGLGVAPQVDVLLFLYNPLPGLHHVIVFPDSDPLRPAMGRAAESHGGRWLEELASEACIMASLNRSDLDRLVPGLIRKGLIGGRIEMLTRETCTYVCSIRPLQRAVVAAEPQATAREGAAETAEVSLSSRAFGKLEGLWQTSERPKDLLGNLSISPLLSGSVLRPIPPGTSFLPPGAIQAAANANSTGLIGQPCPTPENQSKVKVLAVVALQSQALECYAGLVFGNIAVRSPKLNECWTVWYAEYLVPTVGGTYDPDFLDNQSLRQGKNHTVLRLEAYQVSVIPFVRPRRLKEELNDQFRCSHPKIHPSMTLSKLRNLLKAGTKSQLICVYTCIMPCYLY
ncbi:unnamed protein product [Polarella glacialis]|uniref:Uncharacterized protein n=1 Tax=Polarella glacialis TaxID=89957 RepID=A0A813FRH2_POLGL|nr:unnamed protein product [Polarella glacialis]